MVIPIFNASTGNTEKIEKIVKTDAEWKKLLTLEQYRVTRLKETEKPFTVKCPLPPKGEEGIYQCVCCGTDLFRYGEKFDSGTGWPSFWQPVSELNIRLVADDSLGMHRSEVLCSRCDAHLGHVFDDGPEPTGKRYCINAVALKLMKILPAKVGIKLQKATFAAGCFWGVQEVFRNTKGVVSTKAGYTGGRFDNPTYEKVCSDKTGHAEALELEFDPHQVSYEELLGIFWKIHDPTTLNRQGPDSGSQYRSVIFYHSPEQGAAALASKDKLERFGAYKGKIVTEIVPAGEFYPAEEYHQLYYQKHGISKGCGIRLKK